MLEASQVYEPMKPLVSEWNRLKAEDPERIIFVKIGKFYEMYSFDAITFYTKFDVPLNVYQHIESSARSNITINTNYTQ